MATKKRTTKKKLSPLKLGAIAIVSVGGGWLLWSKIVRPYFFKDEEKNLPEGVDEYGKPFYQNKSIVEPIVETPQGTAPIFEKIYVDAGKGAAGSGAAAKFDIDKKVRKGDKSDLVKRIQIAINNIARLRGRNSFYDADKGKTISFPISLDSDFGNITDSALKFAFPDYKGAGFTTVRKAREQWARSAGYASAPFPTELSAVPNYADLKKIYDVNRGKTVSDQIFN
jgi:hypothetical protein